MCIDCWDIKGASAEKCGPKLPSAPPDLSVIITTMNESIVMLSISWGPPDTGIIAYKIVIDNLNTNFTNGVSEY